MTYKVLVSDKLSEDGLEVFKKAGFQVDHTPEITQEEIKNTIGQYHAWVVRSRSKATAEILENAENLRVIGRAGVGVDNVDVAAASKRGIIVMNTPGGNTISTAEHAIAMMMSASRKIPGAVASMREGKWDKKAFMGRELRGKTLGILGLGRIGQEVCKRMKSFGMHILGFDPFVSEDMMKQLGVESADVDAIASRADFITIHTPLSPETKNLINADRLAMMKPSMVLVNCARGGIVDEAALYDALKENKIFMAALDVFESEPIAADHPLRSLDNAIITPHIAASTVEAQENVAIQVAEQIVDVLENNNIINALNAPSMDPTVLETLKPYLQLGEKLGSFAAQMIDAKIKRISCRFSGSILDYPIEPLTTGMAKGIVEVNSDGPVNYVNARHILKERGVEIIESKRSEIYRYSNLMTLTLTDENDKDFVVSGTVFDPDHIRIVTVNNRFFIAVPEGNLVVVENEDVPGVIGAVGTVLGKHGINISEMTWGTKEGGGTAMTIINADTKEVSDKVLDDVRSVDNVKKVALIKL